MRTLILFLTIGLLGLGCGGEAGKGPPMAKVSGTITLKGSPLADAGVHFVAEGFEGFGRTDEKGHYSLVRGAPVGECKVYVTKVDESLAKGSGIDMSIPGMDEEQARAAAMGAGGAQVVKPLLPPEYSDPAKTQLKITVPPEGTETADFAL